MKNNNQKILEQTLTRRFFFLSFLKTLVVGSISWRFFDLQIIENQKYKKLSNQNQFNYFIIPPERGRILDRKMRLLAGNMDSFSLVLNWSETVDVNTLIYKISQIIYIDKKDLDRFYSSLNKKKTTTLKKF